MPDRIENDNSEKEFQIENEPVFICGSITYFMMFCRLLEKM